MLYIRNKIIWKRKVENKARVKEVVGKCKPEEGSHRKKNHTKKELALLVTFEIEFKVYNFNT